MTTDPCFAREVRLSRKSQGGDDKKSMELVDVKVLLKSRGFRDFNKIVRQSPVTTSYNVTGSSFASHRSPVAVTKEMHRKEF